MEQHKQVESLYGFWVDEGIVEEVNLLNSVYGVYTFGSCQGQSKKEGYKERYISAFVSNSVDIEMLNEVLSGPEFKWVNKITIGYLIGGFLLHLSDRPREKGEGLYTIEDYDISIVSVTDVKGKRSDIKHVLEHCSILSFRDSLEEEEE